MNMTAFEYNNSIVVVDCGLAFPEDDMLGIDLVIPDVTYLKENIDRVKGIVFTHGHEDHIGALVSYVRMGYELPPIKASGFNQSMIRKIFNQSGMQATFQIGQSSSCARSDKCRATRLRHGQIV